MTAVASGAWPGSACTSNVTCAEGSGAPFFPSAERILAVATMAVRLVSISRSAMKNWPTSSIQTVCQMP